MKLVANNTISGQKTIRAKDPKVPGDKGEYREIVVKPGEPFDTADLSIGDDEARSLIETGAASVPAPAIDPKTASDPKAASK